MVKITEKVEVSVSITPHEMGKAFAAMHSDEQAQFFDGVASQTGTWVKASCLQWQMMRDELEKLPRGLREFRAMAEYAE
jgi:hypothetical protein